jgi:hypothetical protein
MEIVPLINNLNNMSHEIEADFKENWPDEATQCINCTSYDSNGGHGFCLEANSEVAADSHCDFFQSRD